MVRDIIKDQNILSQISVEATKDDLEVCKDLLDTLEVLKDSCVGLAANMIGELKRVIAVEVDGKATVMINPVIVSHSSSSYEAEEACLSHDDTHKVNRFEKVRVEFLDMEFNKKIKTFSDFEAEVIQHEIDHLNGILV